MPLPKKRHSKARGRRRRTHWKISAANLIACPQCKALRQAHRICPVCGNYNGRQVVEIKVKEKRKRNQ